MNNTCNIHLRPANREDATSFIGLVKDLAEFEKLPPPDSAAQARLIEDAFGDHPRIEVWIAVKGAKGEAVGYAIFLETYSSFLARPTLYIEDVFVRQENRSQGVGSALLRKAVELAHERGCGRVEWTALDWNTHAQSVYEKKMGARRMNEWLHYRMERSEIDAFLNQDFAGS